MGELDQEATNVCQIKKNKTGPHDDAFVKKGFREQIKISVWYRKLEKKKKKKKQQHSKLERLVQSI